MSWGKAKRLGMNDYIEFRWDDQNGNRIFRVGKNYHLQNKEGEIIDLEARDFQDAKKEVRQYLAK